MKKIAIVGGETHLAEVTGLCGSSLEIVATCMNDNCRAQVIPDIDAPNYADLDTMLADTSPEIVAIANENDLK